jgi:hypothetical protein
MEVHMGKEWADMTADERRVAKESSKQLAMSLVKKGEYPTGIKFTIGGKDYIARPQRLADNGGVTYGITPHNTTAGKYNAKFNKFAFTLTNPEPVEPVEEPVVFEVENFNL